MIIYRTIILFLISIVLFGLNPSSLYSAQIPTPKNDRINFSINRKKEAEKQYDRKKEHYYPAKQKKEAVRTYRPAEEKGYCCIKHRLIQLSQTDCENKGLSFYPASKYALAKKQCGVEHGLCCIRGVLRKRTKTQCTRQQGSFFSEWEKQVARNFCKPTPGYCCVNFKIHKTDKLRCKGLNGKFFSQNEKTMALSECRRVEDPHSSQSSLPGSSTPANPDRSKEILQTTSYQDKKIDQAILVAPPSETSPLPQENQNHSVPGQILVTLDNGPHSVDIINELLALYDLTLLEIFELKSLQQKIVLFHTNHDLKNSIDILKKMEGIHSVQQNTIFTTMGEPMAKLQNVSAALDLDTIQHQFRGKNIRVAVIDTGVDLEHKELRERVVFHENFLHGSSYQPEIHGTAVAGIIGASINQTGIRGIAPESELFALRACRQITDNKPSGHCYSSTIAKALDVALSQQMHLVSLCLGSSSSSTDHLISSLIEVGAQQNIIFVAPAGNQTKQKKLAFPASHKDVVAVAGYNDHGDALPNRVVAAQANVTAPASHVLTTTPDNKYHFLNGTSMASATVTGLLTIAREKNGTLLKEKAFSLNHDLKNYHKLLFMDPTH